LIIVESTSKDDQVKLDVTNMQEKEAKSCPVGLRKFFKTPIIITSLLFIILKYQLMNHQDLEISGK